MLHGRNARTIDRRMEQTATAKPNIAQRLWTWFLRSGERMRVEDEEIRALNASFRRLDEVTDVLSFPAFSFAAPADFASLTAEMERAADPEPERNTEERTAPARRAALKGRPAREAGGQFLQQPGALHLWKNRAKKHRKGRKGLPP